MCRRRRLKRWRFFFDFQVGRGGEAEQSVGPEQLPEGLRGEEDRGGERFETQGGDGRRRGEDSDEGQLRENLARGEEAEVSRRFSLSFQLLCILHQYFLN